MMVNHEGFIKSVTDVLNLCYRYMLTVLLDVNPESESQV